MIKYFIVIWFFISYLYSLSLGAVQLSECNSTVCTNYFEKFSKAAKRGHPKAMAILGELYYQGYGTPKNKNMAIKYYKKAAKNGITSAQYKAGLFYFSEKYQNVPKGLSYLKKAAKADYKDANYLLGIIYISKDFGVHNIELADKYLANSYRLKHSGIPKIISYIINYIPNGILSLPKLNKEVLLSPLVLSNEGDITWNDDETEIITVSGPQIESIFELELMSFRSPKKSLGSRLKGVTCEDTVGCKTANSMQELGDMIF